MNIELAPLDLSIEIILLQTYCYKKQCLRLSEISWLSIRLDSA